MEAYQTQVWGKTERSPWAESWGETEWTPAEFDELTDCAERIRAPLDHQLYFDLKDGDLHCNTASNGDGLKEISATALQIAIEATQRDPRWAVEALRRRIEYDEITGVLDMPDGQMLVLSPTPDAAIKGNWDMGVGYNLAKKSIMMRLWKRAGDEFACRYVSLNGGHKAGLAAGIESLGQAQPDGDSSEDWLRGRWYFPADVDVASEVIAAYDAYLEGKFGGEWSYGMEALTEASALELVCKWPDLLEEHMAKLQQAATPAEKEALRYNYAAAIEARRAGDFDVTLDGAGDLARANGEDFSGYCETIDFPTNENALQELRLGRKKWMHCPYCGGSVFGDPCSPGTCPNCGSAPGKPAKDFDLAAWDVRAKTHQDDAKTLPQLGAKSSSHAYANSSETALQNLYKFPAPTTEVEPPENIQKSPDDIAIEAMLERKWRVMRGGILNGIEALVDESTGDVIAVGVKAKKLEYIRQEKEMIWFKTA